MKNQLWPLALLTCAALQSASAQMAAPVAAPSATAAAAKQNAGNLLKPSLQGTDAEGKAFKLAALRGKVVLVLFWSTDCPVCRDKMPELRENYAGWRNKPFELVTVSVDKRMQDVSDYEKIVSAMVPLKQRFVQLWAGAPGYSDNFDKPSALPHAYLLDKTGQVVEQYNGRIPAAAWDRIADLL